MKRFMILLALVFIAILLFLPCKELHAEEFEIAENDKLEIEVEDSTDEIIESDDDLRSMGTVSDYTTYTLLDGGVLQLYVKLDATFLYDGSSATCIANSASYNILNSAWHCDYVNSGRSGNQAWANFSFTHSSLGVSVSGTIYISCSANGVISKS